MCFNFEVSISTFIISWTICLYLLNNYLNKSQRQNVIFLLIFSSIQFADSILWLINLITFYYKLNILPPGFPPITCP